MERLRHLFNKLTGSGGNNGISDRDDNFICGACRSTFERRHENCPNCGSPILVPMAETESDDSGSL